MVKYTDLKMENGAVLSTELVGGNVICMLREFCKFAERQTKVSSNIGEYQVTLISQIVFAK